MTRRWACGSLLLPSACSGSSCAQNLCSAFALICWAVIFLFAAETGHAQAARASAPMQAGSTTPAQAPPALGQTASGSAADATTASSRYKITGSVVDDTTGAPVRNCLLTLSAAISAPGRRRQQRAENGQTVSADESGKFEVTAPSAGAWRLTASARGYRTQALNEHDGYSSSIVLTEQTPKVHLLFKIKPASRIEGYILDEAGEPVRMASVNLVSTRSPAPETQQPRPQQHGRQITDDRGFYRFEGLASGTYTVSVQAQPWYSTAAHRGGMVGLLGGPQSSGQAAPDPLDVVYPVEWFPGATDLSGATPIALREGETCEADMRLLPIQGFHLRAAPDRPTGGNEEGRPSRAPRVTYVTQVLPDGTVNNANVSIAFDGDGALDVSGLAPGTYQMHLQGYGENAPTAVVQIGPGSAHTLDFDQATRATEVVIKLASQEGDAFGDKPDLRVNFLNLATQQSTIVRRQDRGRSIMQAPRFGGEPMEGQSASPEGFRVLAGSHGSTESDLTATLQASLQPGTYEVTLSGGGDTHLAAIEVPSATASGAKAEGRTVTIGGGSPVLVLHTASGRAQVTGFVRTHDQPVEGAMVLLVPSTLGNPLGLAITRRDQSNTDGSFDILNVLPGTYILVAIDHGWDVNWSDSSTLQGYLTHGTPLDLTTPRDAKLTIEARAP